MDPCTDLGNERLLDRAALSGQRVGALALPLECAKTLRGIEQRDERDQGRNRRGTVCNILNQRLSSNACCCLLHILLKLHAATPGWPLELTKWTLVRR
jgi:hypothetical protein